MKKQFRALTLLLVLLLALSSFFGCVQQQRLSEADLAFLALDREYGIYMLMDDPSSIVQFMTKPEDYGIDLSEVEMHLGRFSLDNQAQWYADMRDFSVRLQEIDASKLSAQNKIAYATMEQELADELIAAEKDYDIYYEPLVPYVGMQSNLPLTFAIWELDDVDDIEIYMVLLRDVPAFLENILEWEQLRADAGIFMTEHALDGILDDLGETIKAKDANALLSHFDDCVNAMADLSDEQKAEYIAVHRKVVVNDYNAAFIALRDGLETLRPKCREPLGALASGDEKYMAYFMDRTRITTGYNFDLDEAYAQLEDGMTRWISLYRGAIDQSDDLFEFRMDGVSEAADELRELTYTFLPALQAHSVNYVNVPKELEEQFSPAAYLIPPIDDWFRNTVLVNKPDEDETLFFTMAHEAYPGHLYQYNYQRALDLPLSQDLFHLSAYAEAWSQYGEYLAAKHTDRFPNKAALRYHLYSTFDTLFFATLSIEVNGFGYSAKDLMEVYADYEMDLETWEEFYQICVDMPFYHMPYAFGYANMILLQNEYQTKAGLKYNESKFLTAFLDLGPTYFHILRPALLASLD